MDPSPSRLGALEQRVMDVLWTRGASCVREVIDALPNEPAYTTISTVLRNLVRKQIVTPQRDGKSVRYHPRHSCEQRAAALMAHALATSNDRQASILHFMETWEPDDLALLRDYLADD